MEILKQEYDMKVDRKAVRRNISNLMDCGYNIEYSEIIRMIPVRNPHTGETEMEESYVWSDFYLKRDFTDGELRLLIDSLLFSKHIPYNQCKELVEKLESLSNIYFKAHVKHIARMPEDRDENRQLFYNIELLDEAINKNRKVSFKYAEYGTDKKTHIKKRDDGIERVYIISPYQMAAQEGKYYLICNYDKYNDISNYRLDRIRDLQILDEKAKPFESLQWSGGKPLDLTEYMREHVYMYSGGNVHAKFRIPIAMVGDAIDMFGQELRFFDEDEKGQRVSVAAKVNEPSKVQFAKNFGPDVILLEPQRLVDQVIDEMEKSIQIYKKYEG